MPDQYGLLKCTCGGAAKVACSNGCKHPEFETAEQSLARKALFRPPRQSVPSKQNPSNGGGRVPSGMAR